MGGHNPDLWVIRLWKLPDNFYELALEDQWNAVEKVTHKPKPLEKRRQACPMAWFDEALIVCYFLLTLAVPWVLGVLMLASLFFGWLVTCTIVTAIGLVLVLHPMARFTLDFRSSRLALALIRYFTFELLVNRNDPLMAAVGTSAVDAPEFQNKHLPAIYLACPHGVRLTFWGSRLHHSINHFNLLFILFSQVFNYGAIAWCCISRWVCGWYQYTGAAEVISFVPGLRYLDPVIWSVAANRKNIKKALQVPDAITESSSPSASSSFPGSGAQKKVSNPLGLFKHGDLDDPPRGDAVPAAACNGASRAGGMIGMVPDGILGAFRSKAGVDELAIGKKRGLLRIAAEEGATVYAT